ncbi:D-amino-acid transaminase [Sphingoaurantiacus capsulatus]|uniref:Probable branched-chain-amino-acid aminotransferase n=1 Tax=Sphingoaurantiacus capsulatus TaxID=1771310 RepID=A0ABV7XFT1_9SPHN
MPRIAYVDGAYVPLSEAAVSIEDRGFQFADGVYEVAAAFDGKLFDFEGHAARLRRNLAELSIDEPMSAKALELVGRKLLAKNGGGTALLYIQVTRGQARRDHPFPAVSTPTLVMTARGYDYAPRVKQQLNGVKLLTQPDERWGRCDIKSVALLANVLAKQAARQAGAFEAVLVEDDGTVTEGASTNIWIVDRNGMIVTHPAGRKILSGIVRDTLMRLAKADGLKVVERAFDVAEMNAAAEVFVTSTTALCIGVSSIDGTPVGSGTPGPVSRRLGALVWDEIARQTGYRPAV